MNQRSHVTEKNKANKKYRRIREQDGVPLWLAGERSNGRTLLPFGTHFVEVGGANSMCLSYQALTWSFKTLKMTSKRIHAVYIYLLKPLPPFEFIPRWWNCIRSSLSNCGMSRFLCSLAGVQVVTILKSCDIWKQQCLQLTAFEISCTSGISPLFMLYTFQLHNSRHSEHGHKENLKLTLFVRWKEALQWVKPHRQTFLLHITDSCFCIQHDSSILFYFTIKKLNGTLVLFFFSSKGKCGSFPCAKCFLMLNFAG